MHIQPYIACHDCDLIHRRKTLPPGATALCTRCGAVLYRQTQGRVDLILALTFSGIIALIIACVFPFISLNLEGVTQKTTLITGAVELFKQDMEPVAVLVLATGMIFPILVLAGFTYILIPLKLGRIPWKMAPIFRMILFALPWAMMEVFLLGIFVALVKLSAMATITLGIGLYAFVGLVFIMAAMSASLNPESIWARLPFDR